MLVYTTGDGVNGFTYDRGMGEFCLSHPDMKIPQTGNNYSINQGYYKQFSEGFNSIWMSVLTKYDATIHWFNGCRCT